MEISIAEESLKKERTFGVVETKLLVGDEVFKFIEDGKNQKEWEKLYQECPWKTVFQSRKFVSSWYQAYKKDYFPIMVASEADGELAGLLTMAAVIPSSGKIDSSDRLNILGAGHYRAEYQVWLATPVNSESFIQNALKLIGDRYPKSDIFLRFLPKDGLTDWVGKDGYWRQHCVVQSFRRALIKMTDPDFPKLFTKKEFKNKRNRLQRMDGYSFDRVTDLNEFMTLLPELTAQYDFRQAAMFDKTPFRDAPEMQDLLVALFEKGLLHVTVMRAGKEVLASIVAVVEGKWAHLGAINTHTPFYAKNSPGFVHFIKLGQKLSEEGYEFFDLTAGGDLYKERMANHHDHVYTLLYTQNQELRAKRLVRKAIEKVLVKADIRPMAAELNLKKKLYLFKNRLQWFNDKDVLLTLRHKLLPTGRRNQTFVQNERLYMQSGIGTLPIKANDLNDLLDFQGKGAAFSKWEFLESSMRKYESGQVSYSWSENGKLLACVWTREASDGELENKINGPILEDLYCHPKGKAKLQVFLQEVVARIQAKREDPLVYAKAQAYETVFSKGLHSSGFSVSNS